MIRTSPTISDSIGTVFLLCLVMSASAGLGSSDLQDDCIALFGKPCIGTPLNAADAFKTSRSSGIAGTSNLRATGMFLDLQRY